MFQRERSRKKRHVQGIVCALTANDVYGMLTEVMNQSLNRHCSSFL